MLVLARHRQTAIHAQMISTTPKGQAPCRKPYTDPRMQATANAKMYPGPRSKSVEDQHGRDGKKAEGCEGIHCCLDEAREQHTQAHAKRQP